jgi:hypothetical protein
VNPHGIFESLNGGRVPVQVMKILDGTFENVTCKSCGAVYKPEHNMLYAHYAQRTWVVMQPPADRVKFAGLERGVVALFDKNFKHAPPVVSAGLKGILPRLVFGQHMLAEAVRQAESGMDPSLVECAKLVMYRREVSKVLSFGPTELCFEGLRPDGDYQLAIHQLGSARRVGEVTMPAKLMEEIAVTRGELERVYPALFGAPYRSATRILYGDL